MERVTDRDRLDKIMGIRKTNKRNRHHKRAKKKYKENWLLLLLLLPSARMLLLWPFRAMTSRLFLSTFLVLPGSTWTELTSRDFGSVSWFSYKMCYDCIYAWNEHISGRHTHKKNHLIIIMFVIFSTLIILIIWKQ